MVVQKFRLGDPCDPRFPRWFFGFFTGHSDNDLGCHGPEGDKIAGMNLKSVGSRMNAQQIAAFILNPVAPMPKVFPEPRTTEDERDLRDVAAYVASWPHAP